MPVSASDLAGMRSTVTDFLADTAVIARTGKTLACMVTLLTKDQRIGGLTDPVRIRRWQLTFPDGSDVQIGDIATVSGHSAGIYVVNEMLNPSTYSVSTDAESMR